MNLLNSSMAVLGLTTLIFVYITFSRKAAFESLSLPCWTALTSGIYFYLMPSLASSTGGLEDGFFGMYIDSLFWSHFAVFLYTIGALAAFTLNRRRLAVNPAVKRVTERQANWKLYYLFVAIVIAAVLVLISLNRIRFSDFNSETSLSELSSSLRFINLFLTMMIPLTVIYLIHKDFNTKSLIITAIVMLILLQVGFRYRIVILISAAFSSWMIIRGLKIRAIYVFMGSILGMFTINFIGAIRSYGEGLNFNRTEGRSITDIFYSFGGEIGPVYVMNHIASTPLQSYYYFDPWLVGITRLVPSFLWPNKPTATYIKEFSAGFSETGADKAGIAAPQQVEMLLQFGWIGLPILAFLYFWFVTWLLSRINRLSREIRIAGASLIPVYFGFYMQSRGYFFQILADGIFLFLPLFVMHIGAKKRRFISSTPRPQLTRHPALR